MSDVLVRKLDDKTIEQLKARAMSNGRSLQSELRIILEQSAQPASRRLSRSEYRALADQVRMTLGDRQGDSAILLSEDRAR